MYVDLHHDDLSRYRSSQVDPADFDAFWNDTLTETRSFDIDVQRELIASPLMTLDVYDVSFAGYGGSRVRAWLRVPAGTSEPLPTVIEFIGYGGGRGYAEDSLFWASSGFAHLQMDTRGQGAAWSVGATADIAVGGPRFPGMMTSGIESKESYYYRRLMTDAVRAVDAALTLPEVDRSRLVVLGVSQGGGLALAASGLHPAVTDLVSFVPFLCDFPRAITITDADPYKEISRFLSVHRDRGVHVLDTLSYFDGVNFARRATASAHFSAALMDPICPPSTVVGAFNEYAGPKSMRILEHNGHEHKTDEDVAVVAALRARWGVSRL